MASARESISARVQRPHGVSRPGPCLTPGGRVLAVVAGAVALVGLEVPPAVFVAMGIATAADIVVAIVWFRPAAMSGALPRQAVDGTTVRCVLDHPGLRDEVLLTVDHSVIVGPWEADADGRTVVDVQAPHRGVYPALSVRGVLVGPLGLGCCSRGWNLRLPAPHVVTPRTQATDDALATAMLSEEVMSAPNSDAADHLREYQPGDPVHTVSWAASERHGELLVRSGRGPRPQVRMAVHLGPRPGPTAEAVAGRAMDVGRRHLTAGAQLVVDLVAVRTTATTDLEPPKVSAYRPASLGAPPNATLFRARSMVDDLDRLGLVLAHAVAAPATADHDTGRRWPGTVADGHYDVIVAPTDDELDASRTVADRAAAHHGPTRPSGSA